MTTKEGVANTSFICAQQRAENLSILGAENVIELCVGPSALDLKRAYAEQGIKASFNDINPYWKDYAPECDWTIGDALKVDLSKFNTAVFAPPLSIGFSGKRKDALKIKNVQPSYQSFLQRDGLPDTIVLVLPGRTFSTREDREQLFWLTDKCRSMLGIIERLEIDVVPLMDKRNRIIKYVDVYLRLF